MRTDLGIRSACVVALAWLGWSAFTAADRMVQISQAEIRPVRLAPSETTVAEWMLLPGIGESIAARLDRHRVQSETADWRDAGGWRLDRVRGVGPVIQSDVAPELDPFHPGGTR